MGDIKNDKVFGEKVESFASVIDALLADQKTREIYDKDPLLALKKHGIEFEDERVATRIEKSLRAQNYSSFIEGRLGSNVAHPIYVVVVVVVVTTNNIGDEFTNSLKIDHDRVDTFLDVTALKERTAELEAEISSLKGMSKFENFRRIMK